MVLSVQKDRPLAIQDRFSIIVALLHRFHRLLLAKHELRFIEARISQHVHQQREALIEVRLEAVDRRTRIHQSDADLHLAREKVDRLVNLRRSHGRGAACAKQCAGHSGESDFISTLKIRATFEGDREIDEREFGAWRQEHGESTRQRVAILRSARWLESQWREHERFGSVRNWRRTRDARCRNSEREGEKRRGHAHGRVDA